MNTRDLQTYNIVLDELENEIKLLKDEIWLICHQMDKANKHITHIRNTYNYIYNIFTTMKLEEETNENN